MPWTALCQGLQEAQGEGLNVRLMVFLSYGHDVCLCYRIHQGVESNCPLGTHINQCMLQMLAMYGRRQNVGRSRRGLSYCAAGEDKEKYRVTEQGHTHVDFSWL
jgi:hypothetical protein